MYVMYVGYAHTNIYHIHMYIHAFILYLHTYIHTLYTLILNIDVYDLNFMSVCFIFSLINMNLCVSLFNILLSISLSYNTLRVWHLIYSFIIILLLLLFFIYLCVKTKLLPLYALCPSLSFNLIPLRSSLFIFPSICLSIYPPMYICIYISIYTSIYLLLYLFMPSIYLFIHQSKHIFIHRCLLHPHFINLCFLLYYHFSNIFWLLLQSIKHIYQSIHLSIYSSIHLCHISIYLFINLIIYSSISMSLSLAFSIHKPLLYYYSHFSRIFWLLLLLQSIKHFKHFLSICRSKQRWQHI